jgi:hypothetical protein
MFELINICLLDGQTIENNSCVKRLGHMPYAPTGCREHYVIWYRMITYFK